MVAGAGRAAVDVFNALPHLFNRPGVQQIGTGRAMSEVRIGVKRKEAVMRAAAEQGLLGPKGPHVGARLPPELVARAKQVTGIEGTTELLTYALATVASEDDYGEKLLSRKGRIPRGILFAG